MYGRPPSQLLALIAFVAAMLAAERANSQMIFIDDDRVVSARATYQGVTDTQEDRANFSGVWNSNADAAVERRVPCGEDTCTIGSATSFSAQFSDFYPAAIQFSITTHGTWGGDPSGSYEFLSQAKSPGPAGHRPHGRMPKQLPQGVQVPSLLPVA